MRDQIQSFGFLTHAVVAIDGSKFKAVNNRDKNYAVIKVKSRMEQVNAYIARYLAALDRADRGKATLPEAKQTVSRRRSQVCRARYNSSKGWSAKSRLLSTNRFR